MPKKELCPNCIKIGVCLFESQAEEVAKDSKRSDLPEELLENASETHKKIAQIRIEARKVFCRQVEKFNPNYPGKKSL